MSEFKKIMEDINLKLKKVVEVMHHQVEQNGTQWVNLDGRMDRVEKKLEALKTKILANAKQISMLYEGRTEIKSGLKTEFNTRVTYRGFKKLEKRIAHLENKTA